MNGDKKMEIITKLSLKDIKQIVWIVRKYELGEIPFTTLKREIEKQLNSKDKKK